MVLSYKTSSNKLLCTFVSKWSKQMATLRQISSMVQPSSRKLTLSEYLKNILKNTEHRSGFAQVLNSKIDNLNTAVELKTSSTEGFKNYILNNKI